jgi:hypothetical protein
VKLRIDAGNAVVGVANGVIVPPVGDFDVELRVPDGDARPGLVNAHDHLHRNHYGRLGDPPYANAYEWGCGIHLRHAAVIARGRALPRRQALLRGAWKNLLAGVTTVVHHDAWEPAFDAGFPLRVAPLRSVHSLGFDPEVDARLRGAPFAIHLAEGVDEAAADEVRELARRGLLVEELIAVHVVGADEEGIRDLRLANAAVVWCPTSNEFILGRTAPAPLLADGVDVLLGSDSLLSGAGSLLDELRRARKLRLLSDTRLEDAIGRTAARRLGLAAPSLDEGARADVIVLRRPLLEACDDDVVVVVADGVLRVLDPALLPALGALANRGRIVGAGPCARWLSDQPRGLASSGTRPARHLTVANRRNRL